MRFIMKKYTYNVTSIDTYVTTITVEAETQDEAEELVQKDLDACPIEERSGSFEDNDTQLDLI